MILFAFKVGSSHIALLILYGLVFYQNGFFYNWLFLFRSPVFYSTKNLTPDIKQIDGNHVQLQQVFTNIIINAQQAMPEGGQLFISSRNENGNVGIEFKDTGCGIPEKYKDRIFEPFFTTKMDWKGTGLGLSICYDIVKSHNGSFVVDSQFGKGSVFTIILSTKSDKNV